jgi:hypothetical protein
MSLESFRNFASASVWDKVHRYDNVTHQIPVFDCSHCCREISILQPNADAPIRLPRVDVFASLQDTALLWYRGGARLLLNCAQRDSRDIVTVFDEYSRNQQLPNPATALGELCKEYLLRRVVEDAKERVHAAINHFRSTSAAARGCSQHCEALLTGFERDIGLDLHTNKELVFSALFIAALIAYALDAQGRP